MSSERHGKPQPSGLTKVYNSLIHDAEKRAIELSRAQQNDESLPRPMAMPPQRPTLN